MGDNPSAALLRAVNLARSALVVMLVLVSVAAGSEEEAAPGRDASVGGDSEGVARQERLETLMVRHRCSSTGFGADEIPASTLVLRAGDIRHVSFDHGWAVHTGARAGTLLAVCRDAARPARQTPR